MHGEIRNVNKILVGKTEGKTERGRPVCKWEDITIMDLNELGKRVYGLNSGSSR
jgi:hypothetical protein